MLESTRAITDSVAHHDETRNGGGGLGARIASVGSSLSSGRYGGGTPLPVGADPAYREQADANAAATQSLGAMYGRGDDI